MLTPELLADWAAEACVRFSLTLFDVKLVDGDLFVAAIHIDRSQRSQGCGTAAMRSLTRLADTLGYRIVLTAPSDRLERFYARLGFVRNAAPDKDWNLRARMMRMPR